MPDIELTQGIVQYRDDGAGPPIVLIHGLLVDGHVWDRLVPALSASSRCIVPTLPLGSHRIAMRPGADLSPPGLADLIAELIDKLDLRDVTLVGNDTGGALCQIVAARHPERLGRLVLTNCDAFENFPPPAFRLLVKALARVPGAIPALALLGRSRRVRTASVSFAPLTVQPPPDELLAGWISPLRDRAVRRDLLQVLRGMSAEHTVAADAALARFPHPALIVWGRRDPFFPLADAERLAATIPQARLEQIEDARAFVQMDAPERLAELILEVDGARDPRSPARPAADSSMRQ